MLRSIVIVLYFDIRVHCMLSVKFLRLSSAERAIGLLRLIRQSAVHIEVYLIL